MARPVRDGAGRAPGAPTILAFHLIHVKAGARLQRFGHEAAVVVAPHHHGAVVALGVGGHGHDRAPVADGLKFSPGLAVVIAAGHAGGGQAAEHQETLAAFHRIVDAVQGGDLAAGGPVLRRRQPVAPRHPAIGGPFEDDAALAVALGIHAQNSLAVIEQAGGGVPEVLASFPVHHNLPFGLEGQIDQRNFGGRWGRDLEQNRGKQHGTSFGLVRRMTSSGGCMQAIRVWLSALVALFLVVSMFHVPLIQMWKKQKASAVPVSTAPAPGRHRTRACGLPNRGLPNRGGDTPEATEASAASEPSEPSEASEAAAATGDARVVKIGMYPNMHFSVARFVAQTGERLTVEFENDDPQAQPHNLVFTKPGRRMKVFTDMMRMGPKAVGSGYIPTKSRSVLKEGDDVVAISLLNPGESGSVTFTAPEKPGPIPLRAFTPATKSRCTA